MLSKHADEQDHIARHQPCSHQSEATEIVRQKDHSNLSLTTRSLPLTPRFVVDMFAILLAQTDRKGNEQFALQAWTSHRFLHCCPLPFSRSCSSSPPAEKLLSPMEMDGGACHRRRRASLSSGTCRFLGRYPTGRSGRWPERTAQSCSCGSAACPSWWPPRRPRRRKP